MLCVVFASGMNKQKYGVNAKSKELNPSYHKKWPVQACLYFPPRCKSSIGAEALVSAAFLFEADLLITILLSL